MFTPETSLMTMEICEYWDASPLAQMPMGIIICDLQGIIRWANRAYFTITQQSLISLIGSDLHQQFKFASPIRPQQATIDTYCQGTSVPVRISIQEVQQSSERFLLLSIENLSELYHAKLQIKKSHARFRDVIERVSDIYFIHDLAGYFTYLAPQFTQCFGYSVDSRLGKSLEDIVHPDDLQPIAAMLTELVATRNPHDNIELRVRHQAGHWVWVLASHSVVLDDNGEVKGIQGFVRSINDRKAVELALAERERQLQEIMQNLYGAIYRYIIRPDGSDAFTYVSPSWEKIFGQKPEEVIADSSKAWARVHPDDAIALYGAIQESMHNLTPIDAEYRLATTQDREIWMEIHSEPQLQENGEIWWDGILVDVTARKSAEIELQRKTEQLAQALQKLRQTQTQMIQSEKMSSLGQLVAGIAHEINNPVNFIYGNLTYTERYAKDLLQIIAAYQAAFPTPPDEIQELLQELDIEYLMSDLPKMLKSMQVGSDRIREIVLSLRNFSRLDEAEFKVAKLHTGIDSTLMILQNRLKAKDNRPEIRVHLEYGDCPQVECYAGQLNQVFMNILSNAIDALEEDWEAGKVTDPTITVSIETQSDRVIVLMHDNGQGVPPDRLSNLFDPFYTTKPIGQGTGMGLSISYQIVVERHGGQLECHSTIGSGTTFKMTLPIKQFKQ